MDALNLKELFAAIDKAAVKEAQEDFTKLKDVISQTPELQRAIYDCKDKTKLNYTRMAQLLTNLGRVSPNPEAFEKNLNLITESQHSTESLETLKKKLDLRPKLKPWQEASLLNVVDILNIAKSAIQKNTPQFSISPDVTPAIDSNNLGRGK